MNTQFTAFYIPTESVVKRQAKFNFTFYGTLNEAYKAAAKSLRADKIKYKNLAVIPQD